MCKQLKCALKRKVPYNCSIFMFSHTVQGWQLVTYTCTFLSSDNLALSVVDLAHSAHLTFLDLYEH